MILDLTALTPPARLAIAYAVPDLRSGLALLLLLDDKIAGALGRSSEPLFAQMRIAWWQGAIAKSPEERPKGEPLLMELRELENAGQAHGLVDAMQSLFDAWEILAASEDWSPDVVGQFADLRSKAVFGWYASSAKAPESAGRSGIQWAIDDLSLRFGGKFLSDQIAGSKAAPRILRPLSILAFAARSAHRHVSGPRLIWHAITGR